MKSKNQYLITNCVDKYSVEQDSWKRVSPLPLQLACHAVVTVKNKLYVIGGWTPQVKKQFLVYLCDMAVLNLTLLKNVVAEY
jgi:N-acetylneuraminic acid mutarotase